MWSLGTGPVIGMEVSSSARNSVVPEYSLQQPHYTMHCTVLYCTVLCSKYHFTSAEEDDPPVEEHHHAVPGQGDGQRVHGLADTVVPDLNNRWRY